MHLRAEIFSIHLPRPFRIAHGTSSTRDTVLAFLAADGFEARGEGALPPYYPSQPEDCLAWSRSVDIDEVLAGETLDRQISRLPGAASSAHAARVALEMALHDLHGLRQGRPLWQIFGGNRSALPFCPRTLSIPESEAELLDMLEEAGETHHFKLKLGGGDLAWDERVVAMVRRLRPGAKVGVDANGGWSVSEAAQILPRLTSLGVDYAEQPVAADQTMENWHALRRALKGNNLMPLIADESLQRAQDIPALAGWADAVNVKILKAGGMEEASRWIVMAKEVGLKVMVGVMVETGIGRTAAAHLGTAADWLDIDPPETIPVAPYCGFRREGDRLILSEKSGLGLDEIRKNDGDRNSKYPDSE